MKSAKRTPACISILLLFALLILLVPRVHWRVIGWVKRESFFDGMPTSYWRMSVQRWNSTRGPTSVRLDDSTVISTSSPPAQNWLYTLLGIRQSDGQGTPHVLSCDENSINVLLELAQDADPEVSTSAVVSLRRSPPSFHNLVIDVLSKIVTDEHEDVRREAMLTSWILKERKSAILAEAVPIIHNNRILSTNFDVQNHAQLRLTYLGPQISPTYTVVISTANYDPGLSLHRRLRQLCWNDSKPYRNDPFQTKPFVVTPDEFQRLVIAISSICDNLIVDSSIPKRFSVSLLQAIGETHYGYEFRVAEGKPYDTCEKLLRALITTPVPSNSALREWLISQYCEAAGKEWGG